MQRATAPAILLLRGLFATSELQKKEHIIHETLRQVLRPM